MTYIQQWNELINNQTDETFNSFWESYSNAEKHIYGKILDNKTNELHGTFKELQEKFDVDSVLFMGFLDGINSSLTTELDLEVVDEETKLDMLIDFEKLYFNMHKAEAEHLYTLSQWKNVLSEKNRDDIAADYKKSKTIVKEKEPGRNDPCPCGSGKKYKKCCGKIN